MDFQNNLFPFLSYTNSKIPTRILFKYIYNKNWINCVSTRGKNISVSRRSFAKTGKEKWKLALTRARTGHASITRAKQQNIKKLKMSLKNPRQWEVRNEMEESISRKVR